MNRIIPVTVKVVALKVQRRHLLWRDGHSLGVFILIDLGSDTEARSRRGRCDQTDNDRQADQGLAAPVHGNVGKETVFDLVPLAGSSREVADRDRESGPVREALKFPLPKAWSRSVTATAIGCDQECLGSRIGRSAHPTPPTADRVDREAASIVIDSYADPALVSAQVVDSIRNGFAPVGNHKVVDTNGLRRSLRPPFPATILEIANQFLLLRIDRDDRLRLIQALAHLRIEVEELLRAIWVPRALQCLAVGLQAETALVQQLCNQAMAGRMPHGTQLPSQPT